jgi:hypothetical protein
VPVLPVRLWQEGALLFAASTPADPDHHLRLLEQGAGTAWQWLPLVGADFPLHGYAQRGPLVAWTPHLTGVALKLERRPAEPPGPRPTRRPRLRGALAWSLVLLLLALLAANLGSTLALHQRLTAAARGAGAPAPEPAPPRRPSAPPRAGAAADDSRERFVAALYRLLLEEGGRGEWDGDQSRLLARYERLARDHKDLRVSADNVKGKVAVAAVSVLAGRGADRIEDTVRKALSNKGFSDRLVQAACAHVREQFNAERKEAP